MGVEQSGVFPQRPIGQVGQRVGRPPALRELLDPPVARLQQRELAERSSALDLGLKGLGVPLAGERTRALTRAASGVPPTHAIAGCDALDAQAASSCRRAFSWAASSPRDRSLGSRATGSYAGEARGFT